MTTDTKQIEYVDQPCGRCGSKRIVTRTWKEKIPTYSGSFTEVEYSQIKCSNQACQKEFEKKQREEEEKKEIAHAKKEAGDALRKANSLAAANKTRLEHSAKLQSILS